MCILLICLLQDPYMIWVGSRMSFSISSMLLEGQNKHYESEKVDPGGVLKPFFFNFYFIINFFSFLSLNSQTK